MIKKIVAPSLASLLIASPVLAEEKPEEPEQHNTLAGHTFVAPSYSDSAFNSSHFQFSQGFLYSKLSNFQEKEQRLTLLGLNEKVDLGLKIHERIGIFSTISGDIVAGFNHGEFLYLYGFDATHFQWGASLVPYQNKWGTQIGFKPRGELWYTNALMLDSSALTFSLDIIDKLNKELVTHQSMSGWGMGGSVNTAQAFGQYVSLQTSIDYVRGRKSIDVENTDAIESTYNRFGLGAALSLDLSPHLPIALQTEYKMQQMTDMPDMHYFGGGFYFVEKEEKDLVVGVNAGRQFVEAQETIRTQLVVKKHF